LSPSSLSFWPHRLPPRLRQAAYAVCIGVLAYLCLAPAKDLPNPSLWDKAEHAIAWFVLAGVGLAFWPSRPRRVSGFALAFGALIEVLQAAMPFGRDGDWRDWAADSVGVTAALVCWALAQGLARGLARRAPSQA
jgi:VanZ family protein